MAYAYEKQITQERIIEKMLHLDLTKDLLDLKQILTVSFRSLLSLRGRRLKGEGKEILGAREPRRLQSA